jgi:hypothetical protein
MNRVVRSWTLFCGVGLLGTLTATLSAPLSAQVRVMSRQDGSELRTIGPDIAIAGAKMAMSIGGETERIVKNAPFSAQAVTTTTQVLGDGNRILQTSEIGLARDSEGRTRREMSVEKIGPWSTDTNGRVIFIRDPVGMAIYEVAPDGQHATKRTLYLPTPDDQARQAKLEAELTAAHNKMTRAQADTVAGTQASAETKATMRRDERGSVGAVTFSGRPFEFTTMIVEDGGTAKKEALGEQMIEGVRAEGTRETRTIPAGKIGNERPIEIVSETWYSADLQMVVQSRHSDPRIGETIYRLTNIVMGEPDASQFQVPAGVTVQEEKDRVNVIRMKKMMDEQQHPDFPPPPPQLQ